MPAVTNHQWNPTRILRRAWAIFFDYPITPVEVVLTLQGLLFSFWVLFLDGRDANYIAVAKRFPGFYDPVELAAWIGIYNLVRLWAVLHDLHLLRSTTAFLGLLTWGTLAGLYLVFAPDAHELPGYLIAALTNVWCYYRLALRSEVRRRARRSEESE